MSALAPNMPALGHHVPVSTPATTGARSLTSLAFDRLRIDILSGALRPSEKLRIQALSERYAVGATAIREALSRLVSDGLVDSRDQKGFCVAPVSKEELIDLTQTRVDVEQMALRKAIEHGDVEWESQLLSAFHRLSRAELPTSPDKHAAWALAHRRFHEALIAGCRSPWSIQLCGLLYDKSERYRNLAEQHTEPKERDAASEHKELMDAAMQRDPDACCRLLSRHFWETAEIILRARF